MKNLVQKVRDWFTDNRRMAIQGFLATFGVLAVQLGYATEDQTGIVLIAAGATMQLIQGLLALAFLRASDAAVWFETIGRGLIYGFAAALAPVAVAVGVVADSQVALILSAVSTGLTALSALVAVLNVQAAPQEVPEK